MILINVSCRETGGTYNFRADENAVTERVIPEMILMIEQKEQISFGKDTSCFYLADRRAGRIFDPSRTLKQNGAGPGDVLMLV